MKFSIIIPVYNVEPYLKKCLDSVINQTYDKFEAILICDNSTDKSNKIVDSYLKKDNRLIKFYYENTGLAKAKNIGVSKSTGDYILFLDGDDFLEIGILQRLIDEGISKYDIIRFQAREIRDNQILGEYNEPPFASNSGVEAFDNISSFHYIENSWLYAYNSSFFKENKFMFSDNCIAEDYGLTPLIIAMAKSVKSIDYIGYNYIQRDNSLMSNKDYLKKIKKMDDMLKQATNLKLLLKNTSGSKNIISFLNNSLIYYSTSLKYKDYKKYNKILKRRGCFAHLKGEKFRSKIRSFLIKRNAYIFFNYIKRS